VTWYLSDFARLKSEREGLETFALGADWFLPLGWRLDDNMRLVLDAEIAVGNRIFPIFLRYPDLFPFSPPSVFPRGDNSRWSSHQFGAGGELCLEFGPDNWTPDMTGAQIVESAYNLLSLENPPQGKPTVVASRHVETLGQQLRFAHMRLLVTRELAAFFDSVPANTTITGNLVACYHDKAATYVLNRVTAPTELVWTDSGIPKPFVDEGHDRSVAIFKVDLDTPLPPSTDLQSFKTVCASLGFEAAHTFAIILRGAEIHFYLLWDKDQSVSSGSILPPQQFQPRLDVSHEVLRTKSVALIGCGSLGSKVGTMLARSGIARFFLVDDDVLLPDNFVRNDLDWRDVGSHKASALSRRIVLANPAAQPEQWRARLGGQQSNASAETMLKMIGDCDLIFDATANPDILNLMSAITNARKAPLVWAEVFGGGIGGLIARCRPDKEPSPQHMRRAIENWFADKNAQPVRSLRRYETGSEGPPLIADDADVSAIAAHAARLAIDVLIEREPSLFPHSVYAIGLGAGSVFDQPFQTFPIDVGGPPASEPAAVLTSEEAGEEFSRLLNLIKARTNEASAAVKDS
jgi:sulfur-carrier protein adenylyltransferase/sulfurtransferase